MDKFVRLLVKLGAASMVLLSPTGANAGSPENTSARIHQLDIMLMVSSLHCRFGSDDFQSEYRKFSAANLTELNAAHRSLQAQYNDRYGTTGGKRKLDALSVGMANHYGLGHPWMSCGDLKKAAKDLSKRRQREELLNVAEALLTERPSSGVMLAARR